MKILHVGTFLQGGAGRVITDLVAAQHGAGHGVAIMLSRSGAPGYGHYPAYLEALQRLRVPVQLVDSTFTREIALNLAVVTALDRAYPAGSAPDVIHTHAGVPSLVALLFAGARRHAIGLVQTMHGWGVQKTAEQAAADVAVMNLVDRVAVPSQHAARQLRDLGVAAERLAVVPYGVGAATGALDPADDQAMLDVIRLRRDGVFVIACVGTIGARKNQALLVEALAMLPRTLRLRCLFIGDGDVDGLNTLVHSVGVTDRAQVLGYRRGARQIAALADAIVLPSRSEGQPIAVLEAFQDGPIVVVSNIPELTELVTDGQTGLVFESGNAAALAATMTSLYRLPNAARHAIRAQARAAYAEGFSTAAMVRRYDDIYASAAGPTPATSRPRITPAA